MGFMGCMFLESIWLNIMILVIVMVQLWMSTVVIATVWNLMIVISPVLLRFHIVRAIAVGREEDWPTISVLIRPNAVGIVDIPVILVVLRGMSITIIIF